MSLNTARMCLGAGAIALAFVAGINVGLARPPQVRVTPLFATTKTVMDEPIVYPTGSQAKLTAAIVALDPGDDTGWHTHGVPLAGIVLEGELTVDYGDKGKRVFHTGDAIAEAISVPHNGKNTGDGPMRLFAVYIGAEGVPTTTPAPPAP